MAEEVSGSLSMVELCVMLNEAVEELAMRTLLVGMIVEVCWGN